MARFGRPEDGFDDGHVGDGFFERDRNLAAFEDCARERVALHGVLIGGREFLDLDSAAEEFAGFIDEDAGGTIVRSVEGNLDFDSALRAEELDPLVRDQLRAASEDGLAAGEVEHRRGQAIDFHLRIAVDQADDARRLLAEAVARGLDAVAADIEQRAAAALHLVADVGGIVVEVAEEACHGAQLADAP